MIISRPIWKKLGKKARLRVLFLEQEIRKRQNEIERQLKLKHLIEETKDEVIRASANGELQIRIEDFGHWMYLESEFKGREDMFKEVLEIIEMKMKSYIKIVDGKEVIKEDIPNDDSNLDKYVALMNAKAELNTLVGGSLHSTK